MRSCWSGLPPPFLAATLLLLLPSLSPSGHALATTDLPAPIREAGRCAMYDECGSKSSFGGQLPCPDNEPARKSEDPFFLSLLASLCGEDFGDTTCCTQNQLMTLSTSLAQAEPLLATCPACKNNFVQYYCQFTCSPNQSQFITVVETQLLGEGTPNEKEAIKEVEVNVASEFGEGFFNSCKDVKFGATNGYAMDLLGGGAKNYLAFLRYMGQERKFGGSPFQISYPSPNDLVFMQDGQPPSTLQSDNTTITPLNFPPLSCASSALNARCACPDCPSVCATLPPIASPADIASHRCKVGHLSCFTFSLIIVYAVALLFFFVYLVLGLFVDNSRSSSSVKQTFNFPTFRWPPKWPSFQSRTGYDRVPMEDPLLSIDSDTSNSIPSRSGSSTRPLTGSLLIGAGSTSNAYDGESLSGTSRTKPPSGSSSMTPEALSQSRRRTGSPFDPSSSSTSISPNPFLQPRTYVLNTLLSRAFYRIGYFCAKRPLITLALGLALSGGLNAGWSSFQIETEPVKLWVAPGSDSDVAKTIFDESFGPFYRTEQIFLSGSPTTGKSSHGGTADAGIDTDENLVRWNPLDEPVLNWDRLKWWAEVEESIRSLVSPSGVTFTDVCFSPSTDPLPPPDAGSCVVQSIMGYFGDSLYGVSEDSWGQILDDCANTPAGCLPSSGMPLNPTLLLGGIPPRPEDTPEASIKATEARSVIVTYVVRNSLDPAVVARAEDWERTLRAFLADLALPRTRPDLGLQVSYSTGVSLEEELNKSSNTDLPIVLLSYLLMFAYIAVNLGSSGAGLLKSAGRGLSILAHGVARGAQKIMPARLRIGRERSASVTLSLPGEPQLGPYFRHQILVDSKFVLGLWGILIVLLSVSTSVAVCSALGVKVTLIIGEVLPFLVLAIGVDNIFILSHELDQQNTRAYSAASRQAGGPPVFSDMDDYEGNDAEGLGLAPPEERVARALGHIGPSILLSAACETVAFALGALVGMPAVRNFAIYAAVAVLINSLLQITVFVSAMALDLKRVETNRVDCFPCFKVPQVPSMEVGGLASPSFLAKFIRGFYAPALLKKPVKYCVLVAFSGLFVLSWIGARQIQLGLDQRLALPSNSHLINYFNALDTFLDVGPPVYFVTQGIDVLHRPQQQQLCGRFSTCQELSLANVLEAERKRPDSSFIAQPPAVWIDDFFQWLNPLLEDCCRVRRRDPTVFCSPMDPEMMCQPCFEDAEPAWNITMEGLPEGEEFFRYLNQWLESPTDEACPLGGKAGYSSALKIEDSKVALSHFRTYHTPLKTQGDYINAMAAAQRIAHDLSKRTGATVFPYSLFYVFFDQYSHIKTTTREVLTLALLAVFLVTSLLLGSWRTGGVVVCTVFLTVLSVMGAMGAWGISLNAISLVNLVISVGIAVEFSAHVARAFNGASGGGVPFNHPAGSRDRDERAWTALMEVGSSVLSGITFTKLIGISVLAFTRSKLLEVYFFRMWLILIVSGALHGLVFLPVALSFWGGQGYVLNDDEAWMVDVVGSRYENEGRIFLGDDDSESGDSDRF